jgi:hypothetical protein
MLFPELKTGGHFFISGLTSEDCFMRLAADLEMAGVILFMLVISQDALVQF